MSAQLSSIAAKTASESVGARTQDRLQSIRDDARLATPCLAIDGALVERNIERMATYCASRGLALRPHTKTHKSQRIAQLQLDAGAAGLTVAKPGEARVMAPLGAPILIAYPPITPASLRTIGELTERGDVLVAADSAEAIERLAAAAPGRGRRVGVLVDADVGMHRTGVSDPEQCVALAKLIAASDKLRFDGLFCYPGHIWVKPAEQEAPLQAAGEFVQACISMLTSNGMAPGIISAGSTPTAFNTHLMQGVTEIRPGTYVFNDMNTVRGGFCELQDCAVRMIATVVSTAVPGQVVIDAGAKALAADRCIPAPTSGHGFVVEYPEAVVTALSEEHGQIDVSRCEWTPRVGERVSVIPNHVCPTINLTDSAWWFDSEGSLQELTIDARGMVR
jgi:D-serine deaminase-like pyridoxal phosphate-dependent protein